MSVTKGTGDVGNTFVEVEVKRAWRKREIQVAAELWECGKLAVVCELSKAVWEERERALYFSSLSIPLAFP